MLFQVHQYDPNDVRVALERGLANHLIFRTLLAKLPGTPFHIVVRPSKTLYKRLITDRKVAEFAELQATYLDNSNDLLYRSQMFQADIVRVETTAYTYLIMTYNYSICDALSLFQWNSNLDK